MAMSPRLRRYVMARPMSLMIEGWMPSVGSSSSSKRGRITRARPVAGGCCRPPGRAPAQHGLRHREDRERVVRDRALVAAQRRVAGLEVLLDGEQREDVASLRHI